MRKYLFLFIWLACLPLATRGQTLEDPDFTALLQPVGAQSLQYWFDDDANSLKTTNDLSGNYSFDVSTLEDGLHTLHCMVKGTNGELYGASSQMFLILKGEELPPHVGVQSLQYWFDDDASSLKTTNDLSGNYSFDVSTLEDGLHTLHCMVKGTNGELYGASSQMFLVLKGEELPPHASLEGAKLQYWFDEQGDALQTVTGVSGVYTPDVSALADGLHVIHYVVIGADGKAYSTASDTFIKMEEMLSDETLTSVAAKGIAYWFDDDAAHKKTSTDLSGTYSLDVSALEDGLHVLHYHIVGEDNLPYGVTSTMFLKDAAQYVVHEPARITKYTYWLNNDNSTAKTVTLDQPANAYTLMALLPLEKMPIRSSVFHFQVDDGVPTIYAKNTFNIRFYDSQGSFVDNFIDNERTFIDYSVSQQITDAELLVSGQTVTIPKPGENTIKWYYVTAEPGDSLEFKLDKPATLQLFSPSGIELYTVSGAESVKLGGCHVDESGSYYLALHDATSSNSNTLSLSYNHIDKYAILDFDVDEIGVAESFVPVTIHGNGFDKIKSMELTLNGKSITTNQYVVYNKGHIDAFFSLTGEEPLGDYTLSITFDDSEKGDVKVEAGSPIHLVNPDWGELQVEVASSFTTVTTTYAVIRVKNSGNVAQLYTPLTFSFDKPGAVNKVTFENFFVALSKELQEQSYNPVVWTDDFAGKGIEAESMFLFIPTIKPHETLTFSMSYELNESDVRMYAVAGKSLNKEVVEAKQSQGSGSQGGQHQDAEKECTMAPSLVDYLREHTSQSIDDHVESLMDLKNSKFKSHLLDVMNKARDVTLNAIGIGRVIGNIYNALYLKHRLDVMNLSDYYTEEDKRALINSVHLEAPSDILKDAGHPLLGAGSAVLEWQQIKSSCSQSLLASDRLTMRRSLDPNDIIGYTAESGSKAIKEGLTDISYTIEFENEPELATASAHTIVITDELNASLYNLSTFAATGIKIGSKIMELGNEKSFSKRTMDLRPAVNVIAQVSQTFDEQTGKVEWTIESLDPMTMEPTEDAMQGVLPVNTDGLGVGEIIFNISLKEGLAHGTEIPNKATIVFDTNEPIETPVWTNVIDAVRPNSRVTNVTQLDNGMAEVTVEATDELSGPWQYDIYAQQGTGSAWVKMAENIPVDSKASVKVRGGLNYGFCAVVTDQAGNREEKELTREASLTAVAISGDVNNDGQVDTQDAILVIQHYLGGTPSGFDERVADMNNDGNIDTQDAILVIKKYLGIE